MMHRILGVFALLSLLGGPAFAALDADEQLKKQTSFFHGTWDCDGMGTPPAALLDKSAHGKQAPQVKLAHRFTFEPGSGMVHGTGVGQAIPQVPSMKEGSKSQHAFSYVPGKGLVNKHTNEAGVTVDWTSPGWDAHGNKQVWSGHATGKITQNLRTTVTKTGPKSFETVFERQEGGHWVKAGSSKCKLVKHL
jgi:hypothetical protein